MKFIKKLEVLLGNPESQYRAKPFWAWNGKLESDELRRQIRIMHGMGLGGFFMHSRIGLETPYLSKEWFDCIEACIEEAKKHGMEAWLYDEDRWPSGAAGGLVTQNPKYRRQRLEYELLSSVSKLKWDTNVIAVFSAKISGQIASEVVRLKKKSKPKLYHGHKLLVFRLTITSPNDWFNGQTYLDTMNPQAVKKFIEVTHEQYKKRFGNEFGKTIPGIFTDEPYHGATFAEFHDCENIKEGLPWTEALPKIFKNRFGYDILDHLVELIYDVNGEKISKARHDYHDCITYMFTEAFAKTIGQWCDEAGIKLTGHVLYESALSQQTHVVGSAMRFYEHMQAPGVDMLTEYQREFDTVKQVSSAARQFGKRWRLTETYGCTGWQFPLAGHKALGDWQLALGINLRCQHLFWHTMEGEAKRDYPASISHHSPWWEIYPKVEDYFARAHALMAQGQEVRDLLVVHPIESTWSIFNPNWKEDKEIQEWDKSLVSLRDSLLGGNIDFDFGDEDILARHGRVVKKQNKPTLKVGQANYTAVLVPPMITMRSSTLGLLKKFQKAGMKVVFAGKVADYLDVKKSEEIKLFAKLCSKAPAKGAQLVDAVETCRRVSIADKTGWQIPDTLYLLREDQEAWYLFICNYGVDYTKAQKEVPVLNRRNEFPDVCVKLFGAAAAVIECDCANGKCYSVKKNQCDDGIEFHTSLEPLGSRLFVLPKKCGKPTFPVRESLKTISRWKIKKAVWDISLSECNPRVLDRPTFQIANRKWHEDKEILQVDRSVRDVLNLKYRGGMMCQPWTRTKNKNPKSVPVELAYDFEVKAVPSGDIFVGIERPGLYRIFINDNEISVDNDCGWWVDKSLRCIRFLPTMLKPGINKLRLICDYNENHPGFEIVYLLGNFGTKVRGTEVSIIESPQRLKLGDWTKQGLSFYSGSVSYLTKIETNVEKNQRMILRVPSYYGTAVRIWVDAKPAGVSAWPPNEVDITDYLTENTAEIAIEVFSHRANSHGPLHLKDKEPFVVGPFSFISEENSWTEEYNLVPCGLQDAPELIIRGI